jgi:uncharacterized protein (DUF58 family)
MLGLKKTPTPSVSPDFAAQTQASDLAARLPHLAMEARRVVSAIYGMHGRRKAGAGETFWQYRPYAQGESARHIDWRRSSRDDRLYVREREWEAAHAVYLWWDRSRSMDFGSSLSPCRKIDRAFVIGFAIADILVDAGESVGLLADKSLGGMPARSSRYIVRHLVQALTHEHTPDNTKDQNMHCDDLPPAHRLHAHTECLLLTDALSDPVLFGQRLRLLSEQGARGHVVHLIDPVEETFPYTGEVVLTETEEQLEWHAGDARAWGDEYRQRFARHQAEIQQACVDVGWTYIRHHTDHPATQAALPLMLALAGRG